MTYRKYPEDTQGPAGPPGPAGTGIVVANGAAFAGVSTTLLAVGTLAWITCYRTWGRLALAADAGPVVADEVFAADVAGYRWVRMETPVGAWLEPLVYMDGGAGSNENPGTLVAPIRTAAEWFRRNAVAALEDYELRNVSGAPIVDIVGTIRSGGRKWSRVKLSGTPIVAASGLVTAISAPVEATNTEAKLTGPVANWAAYVTAQSVLRTLLPSNAYGHSAVGTQAVVGTAETSPWVTATPNTAGVYTSTGTGAAPAVGATVDVLTLPQVTGEFRITGDAGITFAFESLDLSTIPGQLTVDCRQFYLIGCRFFGFPGGTAGQVPQAIAIGGCIPGTAAQVVQPSARFVVVIGTACFRTWTHLNAEVSLTLQGLCLFGAGFTMGNTVGGFGPSCTAACFNGGGGCIGLQVYNPAANANSNPGADCVVLRGGAWLNASGTTSPIMGRANAPGSVFVRVWAGGTLSQGPGYTSKGTGAAKDWDVGAFGASPATVMPPIEAAGPAPAPLAIPGGVGAGWALFNAATPAGFSRYVNWRGCVLLGAQ